jgi:hypothetical protein
VALLDVGVERQRQRRAGRLRMGFRDRHRLTERVAHHTPLARATLQERVARVLDARQPVAFRAHDPQHLRRERAARVDPAHDRRARHPRDLQGQDLRGLPGRERPRQIDEAGAL